MNSAQSMESIKLTNTQLIMRTLFREGPMARVDLAKRTGLTRTTVSNLTSVLDRAGLLKSVARGESSPAGGRRSTILDVREIYSVGVDIRYEKVSIVVLDVRMEVQGRVTFFLDENQAGMEVVDRILGGVSELVSGVPKDRIVGLGVGVIGPIDYDSGKSLNPTRGWSSVPLTALLSRETGLPVHLDSGSNMAAFGEIQVTPDFKGKAVLYITLGSGIGCGLVIEGQVYQRKFSRGLGHLSVNAEGPRCPHCGNRGCLELYASNRALIDRYVDNKSESNNEAGNTLGVHTILSRAMDGEPEAIQSVRDIARYIGIGITSMINVFSPEVIIIGGSDHLLGDVVTPEIKEFVGTTVPAYQHKHLTIVPAKLKENIIAIGGAAYALDQFFTNQKIFQKYLANLLMVKDEPELGGVSL